MGSIPSRDAESAPGAASQVHRPGERAPAVGLVARCAAAALGRRLLGRRRPGRGPAISRAALRRRFQALAAATPESVGAIAFFDVPANRPPWLDTGIDLEAGEQVGWFAAGETRLSGLLDIFVGPDFQLWARIGDGEIFRGTRACHGFRAEKAGRLQLASYFPGEWTDRRGGIAGPPEGWSRVGGGMTVAVVRWRDDPREALARWRELDDPGGLVSAELARMAAPPGPPPGWRYLFTLGPGEIFSAGESDGRACLHCHTRGDVGILQKDVALPLVPGTRLRWEWKVDALPSRLREDSLPTHDYLSLAVEFENGLDLTYTISPELPEGYAYWCPLPGWKDRELHVVVRSGAAGLGAWLQEERDLHADTLRYFGSAPERVVRVWLIAVSIFQRGEGRCSFRRIELGEGAHACQVV